MARETSHDPLILVSRNPPDIRMRVVREAHNPGPFADGVDGRLITERSSERELIGQEAMQEL
jgi:hypothetical protein